MDIFEIIMQTAEEIAKEQPCWQGGLKDFVALSSSVSHLNTYRKLCSSSRLTCLQRNQR